MEQQPKPSAKDVVYQLAKGAISTIPYAGGLLSATFETAISAPIDKRKREWLEKLAERVEQLCAHVSDITPENLATNDAFITAVLQASNIAMRTHSEDKIEALLSAVQKFGSPDATSETRNMMYLRILDQMTSLHLVLLRFFADPQEYIKKLDAALPPNLSVQRTDLRNVWNEALGEPKADDPIVGIAIIDLKNWGLIHFGQFYEARIGSTCTKFGREFLSFIE